MRRSRFPANTTFCEPLRFRCYRHYLYYLLVCSIHLRCYMGQLRDQERRGGQQRCKGQDGLRSLWFWTTGKMQAWAGECRDRCAGFVRNPVANSVCHVWALTNDFNSILWVATSAISIYGVIYYRKNGSLPGTTTRTQDPNSIESQTKSAFSSNPHDNFDADEELGLRPDRNEDDEYTLLHTDTSEGTHPGRPLSWGREHAPGEDGYDTSYHGGGAYNPQPDTHAANPFNASHELPEIQAGDPFRDDLGLSHEHGGYDSGGIVPFPSADYHR